ncbi:hypothetical protein [Streptomyces sp. PAL114]|uniref:hypothetical protein n=1 Tax=Streptomyces sp. PAL114 TaxID=2970893 RepID=UPI00396768DB
MVKARVGGRDAALDGRPQQYRAHLLVRRPVVAGRPYARAQFVEVAVRHRRVLAPVDPAEREPSIG